MTDQPPIPTAPRLLATFQRGARSQIRFAHVGDGDKTFVAIHEWYRATDGGWYPLRKGIFLRLSELPELLAALETVVRSP